MGKVNHHYAKTTASLVTWVIVKHHGTVVVYVWLD